MAKNSVHYASIFFVQKRLIFDFTLLHQVFSELFEIPILQYDIHFAEFLNKKQDSTLSFFQILIKSSQ